MNDSDKTFACDDEYCGYNKDGQCVYNISSIKIPTSRSCYDELRQSYYESELDYLDSLEC